MNITDEIQIEPNYSSGPDVDLLGRKYAGATPAGFVESEETTYRFAVPRYPMFSPRCGPRAPTRRAIRIL